MQSEKTSGLFRLIREFNNQTDKRSHTDIFPAHQKHPIKNVGMQGNWEDPRYF